ncbi:hypothetical protein ACEPAG_8848 [Sanghuangporus baumii]
MASSGNNAPNSDGAKRGLRHRLSRISLTQGSKGSDDAKAASGTLASRPKIRIQPVSPSDHAPSSSATPSPTSTADIPDKELLERAKRFTDEYTVLMKKRDCFQHYRGKVILYLAARQKREKYVSQNKKEDSEIKGEVTNARKALQQAHLKLVEEKEKSFGTDRNSNDKRNTDTEAFSENILQVLKSRICPIDKAIEVLSYLNKAVETLDKLCNTYKMDVFQLRLDCERLEWQQQQSVSEHASTTTTKMTADTYHSKCEELYRKSKDMSRRDKSLQIDRYNLITELDRQMEKTKLLRRKLEAQDTGV